MCCIVASGSDWEYRLCIESPYSPLKSLIAGDVDDDAGEMW